MFHHKFNFLKTIKARLIFWFIVVGLIAWYCEIATLFISERGLSRSVGKSVKQIADHVISQIDKNVADRMNELFLIGKSLSVAELAKLSSEEFDKQPNVQEHINTIDAFWRKKQNHAYIQSILNNELSRELNKQIQFYKQHYGYKVFAEIFTTNKYGVIIGSSGKTTDYIQADEEWYQKALAEKTFWAGNLGYDESSDTHSLNIVVKLYDKNGDFTGMLKGVLNIDSIKLQLDLMQENSIYKSIRTYLVDKNGLLIFSTLNINRKPALMDIPLALYGNDLSFKAGVAQFLKGNNGFLYTEEEGQDLLVTFTPSPGYKKFKGLGWGLITDYDRKEILIPVLKLRHYVLIFSLFEIIFILLIGRTIYNSVGRPIKKLTITAENISHGDFSLKPEHALLRRKDEIGLLATFINKMTIYLIESKVRLDEKVREVLEKTAEMFNVNMKLEEEIKNRVQIEKELKKSHTLLETRVRERTEDLSKSNFIMSQEIIKRQKIEKELKSAKTEAETASRIKSEFLASMSHEIRTPMNAIIGMTHLCLQTSLTEIQKNYLGKIESSSTLLLDIINDILDLSKIEADKVKMESVDFYLSDVLNNLASFLNAKAGEKGIELFFSEGENVPLTLVGDSLRLGQVLINLTGNAIKFTNSGEVVIKTELVKEEPDRVTLKFSIRDTGIGLTQDQIADIFRPFRQADVSTTRKYGGTGLGLAISSRLVELMGGEISVESEPGKGSTFSFTAVFGRYAEEKEKPLTLSVDLRGKKVLVVDDNQTVREILKATLESFTFEVRSASSCQEALAELEKAEKEKPYELVLMDWKMLGMDGIGASTQVKNFSRVSGKPVILIIPFKAAKDLMQHAEKKDFAGVLMKPFNKSTLFNTIMDVFGKKIDKRFRPPVKPIQEKEAIKKIRGAEVLLVEDNEINQEVAKGLLESIGVTVKVANNGLEAIKKISISKFDGILMDIQMPGMNGYKTTRIIRSFPQFRTLPIIAVTASAMVEDLEKCLASGMNDYVPTPINPEHLASTLIKWIKPKNRKESAESIEKKSPLETEQKELPGMADIDVNSGLERVGGNVKLYRKFLTNFQRDYSDSTNKIKRGLESDDRKEAEMLAHTIKGVSGNIGAGALYSAAAALETGIREEKKDQYQELLDNFEKSLGRVLDSLKNLEQEAGEEANEKKGGPPVAPEILLESLKNLQPHVQSRKPKECAPIMEEILNMAWPDVFDKDIKELDRLIGNYKFKEAQAVLKSLIQRL